MIKSKENEKKDYILASLERKIELDTISWTTEEPIKAPTPPAITIFPVKLEFNIVTVEVVPCP